MTAKPWFGPRILGWGWRPLTWQGWLISLVFVLAIVVEATQLRSAGSGPVGAALVATLALFALVCYLTGGRPGGPTGFGPRR